jgi:hypothetical protein
MNVGEQKHGRKRDGEAEERSPQHTSAWIKTIRLGEIKDQVNADTHKEIYIIPLAPASCPVFQSDILIFFSHKQTSKDGFSGGNSGGPHDT